jgi:hypothetical protein
VTAGEHPAFQLVHVLALTLELERAVVTENTELNYRTETSGQPASVSNLCHCANEPRTDGTTFDEERSSSRQPLLHDKAVI